MKRVMVRYKLKPGKSDENEALVRDVFSELADSAPEDVRYATFKLEDGLSFVHIASIETEDGSNPLAETTAFKAFQAGIQDRCDEPPVAKAIEEVGSYRVFG